MTVTHTPRLTLAGKPLPVTAYARYTARGLIAGTRVETAGGWRPVETLAPGTLIHTLDGGLQPLTGVDRGWLHPVPDARLLHLPGGVLDNCADLMLLPDQALLIDTGRPGLPCDRLRLIVAAALDGYCGARLVVPESPIETIQLRFAAEEVIFANSGVMLHCPGADSAMPGYFRPAAADETAAALPRAA